MDDQAAGFSKRKYEGLNDKRRRMGEKKKQLKKFKANNKLARKAINKTRKWMTLNSFRNKHSKTTHAMIDREALIKNKIT